MDASLPRSVHYVNRLIYISSEILQEEHLMKKLDFPFLISLALDEIYVIFQGLTVQDTNPMILSLVKDVPLSLFAKCVTVLLKPMRRQM